MKKTKLSLQFMSAYADVYGLTHLPVTTVINIINEELEYYANSVELFMETFVELYQSMKENHLEAEVKDWMSHTDDDFFTACFEFDL